MRKERREYIKSCEISETETVVLGGIAQKILIEGSKNDQPVILFLHGGPGFPAPFCVGARGLFPEITKRFTAVYWDQYGCGANRGKVSNDFHISRFADMTADLVRHIKKRFAQPLYLFAISWGTALSAHVAAILPEEIAGVYAVGQIVLPPMLSPEAFAAIENSKAPAKVKKQIAQIKSVERPSIEQIGLLSKTMRKYTSAYGIKDKSSPAENPMKEIFASKDYSFAEKLACFVNGYAKNTSLLTELSTIDLRDALSAVQIPYRMFGGSEDPVTSAREVQECVSAAGNKNLSFRLMQGEGHVPSVAVQKEIFAEIAQAAGI